MEVLVIRETSVLEATLVLLILAFGVFYGIWMLKRFVRASREGQYAVRRLIVAVFFCLGSIIAIVKLSTRTAFERVDFDDKRITLHTWGLRSPVSFPWEEIEDISLFEYQQRLRKYLYIIVSRNNGSDYESVAVSSPEERLKIEKVAQSLRDAHSQHNEGE